MTEFEKMQAEACNNHAEILAKIAKRVVEQHRDVAHQRPCPPIETMQNKTHKHREAVLEAEETAMAEAIEDARNQMREEWGLPRDLQTRIARASIADAMEQDPHDSLADRVRESAADPQPAPSDHDASWDYVLPERYLG